MLVVVRYDNSGYSSFTVMTLEQFKEEEKNNFIEHEPCYISSIEELEKFISTLPIDSQDIEMYLEMIEEYNKSLK